MDSRYQNNLSTLAKRLRPYFVSVVEGSLSANEWDKIIRIVDDGGGWQIYPVTAAGLTSALGDAGAGDLVWLPPCHISGDFTVPANVNLVSMGDNAVIDGKITLAGDNSAIERIVIQYYDSSGSALVGVEAANSTGISRVYNCGVDVDNSGAGGAYGIQQTGDGSIYVWNSNVYGNASGGGDGFGIYEDSDGLVFVEGGWLRGTTSPAAKASEDSEIPSFSEIGTGKVLNIGVGGSPPADWDELSFDDSAWAASVDAHDNGWGIPISGTDWISYTTGSTTANLEWLFRHEFTLNLASIESASLEIRVDDILVDVFINGDLAWDGYDFSGGLGAQTQSLSAALFDPSGDNVIALHIKNGVLPVSYSCITYKLTLVIDDAPTIITHAVRIDPPVGEPAQGDKGVWNVVDYAARHAKDISDSALLRHLPAPGTSGNIAQDDGTNWISTPLSTALGSSISIVASENLTAGDLVDIWNDSGTAKARLADTAEGYLADGYVISAVTSGNAATVYLLGINNQLSGMTPGAKQFLSTNGDVTETAPSTSSYIVQEVGIALSATEMKFEAQQIILLN